MTKAEAARKYGSYRRNLFFSIVERIDDLKYLKRSSILSKNEKELVQNAIDNIELLRVEFATAFKKYIKAKQPQPPVEDDIPY